MKRKRQGQALVEFALCLPILLLILFGIMDFGRMFLAQHTMTLAAQNATRAAIIPDTQIAQCDALIASSMNAIGYQAGDYVVTYSIVPGGVGAPITGTIDGSSGDTVRVEVQLQNGYQSLFPGLLPFMDGLNITGSTSMRHE